MSVYFQPSQYLYGHRQANPQSYLLLKRLPNLCEEANGTERWETCSQGLYYNIIFISENLGIHNLLNRIYKKLILTREMARSLKNGDWLGNDHIYLSQELLRKQFPHIDQLQLSLLCQDDWFIYVMTIIVILF